MNVDASVPLQRATPIIPLFSGASVGMTRSAPHADPFLNLCDMGTDLDQVFVMIAEILPGTYSIVARENYLLVPPGRAPKKVVFSAEIDEDILVSCNAVYQCVAVKLEGFACWYQFEFEYETEYFGCLATITQVRNSQVHRRRIIEQQLISFREGFLTHFRPTIPPYSDLGGLLGLIELEAEAEEAEEAETVCDGQGRLAPEA